MSGFKTGRIAVAGIAVLAVAAAVWVALKGGAKEFGVSAAPARAPGVVRIATYNIDDLYDAKDDPGLSGEREDTPTPEARLAEIADAIYRTDADIVALQGVESFEALTWFRDAFLADRRYEHVVALDVGHPRGLENGVLSRFRLSNATVWPDQRLTGSHPDTVDGKANEQASKPLRFRRSPLMVQVEVPRSAGAPRPVVLLIVESKGGDAFEYWREAEARAIIEIATGLKRVPDVCILGSFHAEPDDRSVRVYLEAGFRDAFGGGGEWARRMTETSGDRTDLILANSRLHAAVVPGSGIVIGGSGGTPTGSTTTRHLPVVVEFRPD